MLSFSLLYFLANTFHKGINILATFHFEIFICMYLLR